ncbi:TrbC/VirB2 family protein [Pseudovibrio exalbescens]|uniref:TrbC/VirB2 family protein n=1 Tax=Pseudovibrio exalbescens TaxID=197461 RepID=UPI002365961A|nr:TrbC/VirB2 family protein [Pseudovibrio exalbescens]MDD7911526.1 TrbC/VirB2 family protein [Pseudovibrio exalbescens]
MLIAASVLPTQVAASGWAEPAEGVLEDISTGLVSMSSRVIAIGIVIIGGWAAGSGYIDKKKMFGVVAGEILIFYGPQAIEMLVGAA